MKNKEIKHGEEWLACLCKLTPEEFIGAAKWLEIKVLSEEVDPETHKAKPRDAADIMDDLIVKFASFGRADRRFLLKEFKRITAGR